MVVKHACAYLAAAYNGTAKAYCGKACLSAAGPVCCYDELGTGCNLDILNVYRCNSGVLYLEHPETKKETTAAQIISVSGSCLCELDHPAYAYACRAGGKPCNHVYFGLRDTTGWIFLSAVVSLHCVCFCIR